MNDTKDSDRYRCPVRDQTFNRWQVVTVSPHGNGVFKCPYCGAHKLDSTGSIRVDHVRNVRAKGTDS